MDYPLHDAVGLQLTKLLREHLLGNCRNRAIQVGKAQSFAAEQMEEDQQLPAALDEPECLLDALGNGYWRVLRTLTSG